MYKKVHSDFLWNYSVNSEINFGTVVISLIFQAFAPQKISPLSTSPVTARTSAIVIQYGVVCGEQPVKHLKQLRTISLPLNIFLT